MPEPMNATLAPLMNLLHGLKPLLQPLVLPPVPLLLMLLLGVGLLRQRRTLGRLLLGIALPALWFSFTEVGADGLQRLLLGSPQALDIEQIERLRTLEPQRTAILVLGAGVRQRAPEYGGAPVPKALTLERLRYGVWLARRTGLPLGFSGGVGWGGKNDDATEAQVVQQVLADDYGLRLRWAESQSRDTRENATLSLPMLQQAGIKRLVLVTHAQHMPRAERAFRQAASAEMEIWPAPVGLRNDTPYEAADWLPSTEGYKKFRYVVYEWLGLRAGR